jgi:XTP/dITP diphosphohydrolase
VTKRLLLATQNAKKGRELAGLCEGRFEVVTLDAVFLADIVIVEDAPDFAGNARKKVDTVVAALRANHNIDIVVGDDSGLCVDALDGRPGVRSARLAEDAGFRRAGNSSDEDNNRLLLAMMAVVPDGWRGAHFVCALHAAVLATGKRCSSEGKVQGQIARERHGEGGFGYDPLFLVNEANAAAMATLSSAEKQRISHRGHAIRQLLSLL